MSRTDDSDPQGRSPSGPRRLSSLTGSSPERRPAGRGLLTEPPLTVKGATAQPTPPPASCMPPLSIQTYSERSGDRPSLPAYGAQCPRASGGGVLNLPLTKPAAIVSARSAPPSTHGVPLTAGSLTLPALGASQRSPRALAQCRHGLRMLRLRHSCVLAHGDLLVTNVAISKLP